MKTTNKNKSAKVKEIIKSGEFDAVLISSVHHISHLTGYSNFSNQEREAFLLVTQDSQYIFTDGRYTEAIAGFVQDFELLELTMETPLEKHLEKLSRKHRIKRLGIEEGNLTVAEFNKLKKTFSQINGAKIDSIRSIKEGWEIGQIERACQLGDKAFDFVLQRLKPGMSEIEVAYEMEMFIRENGASLSFDTIIGFGNNSSVPHHHTGKVVLEDKPEQFILMDFGVRFEGYCSDMTRTVFWRKASAKQKKIYQTVFDAQKLAAEFIDKNIGKEGNAAEAARIANDYIVSKGFPAIPHGLGHGVGLEIHEHPRLGMKSKDVLVEGMVFSIEPGVYIPGFGGVRIEDLYTIQGNRLKQITQASKELIEL